jgi:hypothetical protein
MYAYVYSRGDLAFRLSYALVLSNTALVHAYVSKGGLLYHGAFDIEVPTVSLDDLETNALYVKYRAYLLLRFAAPRMEKVRMAALRLSEVRHKHYYALGRIYRLLKKALETHKNVCRVFEGMYTDLSAELSNADLSALRHKWGKPEPQKDGYVESENPFETRFLNMSVRVWFNEQNAQLVFEPVRKADAVVRKAIQSRSTDKERLHELLAFHFKPYGGLAWQGERGIRFRFGDARYYTEIEPQMVDRLVEGETVCLPCSFVMSF